jgi:hypothetical protein
VKIFFENEMAKRRQSERVYQVKGSPKDFPECTQEPFLSLNDILFLYDFQDGDAFINLICVKFLVVKSNNPVASGYPLGQILEGTKRCTIHEFNSLSLLAATQHKSLKIRKVQ